MNSHGDTPLLILHIGLGKTGSTVLQQFFSANREKLLQYGITYPAYGEKGGAHHQLSPHLPDVLKSQWETIAPQHWVPELARSSAGTTLLSSELIASCDEDTVASLCSTISSHFDLKVMAYVRRQDNSVMANYNQQVKTGKQRHRILDVYERLLPNVDFVGVINRWARCIGEQNIIVRPYEYQQFHGGDIRFDFLFHVFGLENVEGFDISQPDSNPRFDAKVLEYKRLMNSIVTDTEENVALQRLLSRHAEDIQRELGIRADTQDLLPPRTRQRIIDAYEDRNQEVARTYLGRPDGRLFHEPPPTADRTWAETSLSSQEIIALSDFLSLQNPALMRSIKRNIARLVDSEKPVQSRSARLLAAKLGLGRRKESDSIRKLIIHAGTHKTGSTAIQASLAARGDDPGFCFIQGSEANSSLLMMQAFSQDLSNLPHFQHENLCEEDVELMRRKAREKLRALCENARGPLSILSAEEVSTFRVPELEDIYGFMAPLFDEIEVFLYVRPLKARMESTYQEVLKTRFRPLDQRFPLNYMGLARNFDSVFGRENVHFFKFSRDAFPQGSIESHFNQAAGLEGTAHQTSDANERLSREAVQLLYAYRLFFPHSQQGEHVILDTLATLPGQSFHFHSSLYRKLLHTVPNASARFAERSGFGIEEDLEAHDDTGIRDEPDLLAFPQTSIDWLHRQLSVLNKVTFRKSSRPERVARAIDSLRRLA